MSKALYLLQQDAILNGKRLDVAREVVDNLLEADEYTPIGAYLDQLKALKKLLKYTGAENSGRN